MQTKKGSEPVECGAKTLPFIVPPYARRMGQPTQRATNYTARSNIDTAHIFLHANGQSAPRSGGARDVGRGAGSHTPSTASESFSHSDIDEKRPTEKFVLTTLAHLAHAEAEALKRVSVCRLKRGRNPLSVERRRLPSYSTALLITLAVESTEGISEIWFRETFPGWGFLRFG